MLLYSEQENRASLAKTSVDLGPWEKDKTQNALNKWLLSTGNRSKERMPYFIYRCHISYTDAASGSVFRVASWSPWCDDEICRRQASFLDFYIVAAARGSEIHPLDALCGAETATFSKISPLSSAVVKTRSHPEKCLPSPPVTQKCQLQLNGRIWDVLIVLFLRRRGWPCVIFSLLN